MKNETDLGDIRKTQVLKIEGKNANGFKIVDVSPSLRLDALEELSLAFNHISSIENFFFPCLKILNLNENCLVSLEGIVISPFLALKLWIL